MTFYSSASVACGDCAQTLDPVSSQASGTRPVDAPKSGDRVGQMARPDAAQRYSIMSDSGDSLGH